MRGPPTALIGEQVRQRLVDIVEHEVALVCKKRGGLVQLNDAYLEEWKKILERMLAAPSKHHKLEEQAPPKLPLLNPVPPLAEKSEDTVLLRVEDNKFDIYARSELSQRSPKPRRLTFEGDIFKRFSAYCCLGA